VRRSKLTVLLAEDDPNDQVFLKRAFEESDDKPELHVVANGDEAISYLKGEGEFADRISHPYPSLLITDLKMFPGDGFSVLLHLKNTPERAIIPTIVLSASSDADDIRRSYQLGAIAYLTKPHSFEALSQLIRNLLVFWLRCEVPEVNEAGEWLQTQGTGKLGEKYFA
jgi:CheY-like chemotaxis protein